MNRPTRVCAVSFKECWQDENGVWYSNGGFPLQMAAIASLFDRMTLMITRRDTPGSGALPLPGNADVVVQRKPEGTDFRRKMFIGRHLFSYLREIARHARTADAVHVPPPGDLPLLGMLVAIALRKRLIVRYCGSWQKTSRTTMTNRITRGLMRLFAGGRNLMLATGESDEPPARGVTWIFSTGLSKEELALGVAERRPGLQNPPRLAYVGRLSPEKGLDLLVQAVARLRDEGFAPLPKITLIGDGPERPRLESLVAEARLTDAISFAGQLNREDLRRELARADLGVHPSHSEGYSKAWLDAFSCGLPVLSTQAGAALHVIGARGERGWLVPPGDVDRLTDALRRVLTEDRDWAGLRDRCRAFAEARTLESWASEIGRRCAEQWRVPLVEGKLVL